MVDFADRIRELAGRIPAQIEHIASEEATKNALVLPFISALGYNVFDSREVTPELTADVGTKKGEKVDYAILQDGQPILLFECKPAGTNLDQPRFCRCRTPRRHGPPRSGRRCRGAGPGPG